MDILYCFRVVIYYPSSLFATLDRVTSLYRTMSGRCTRVPMLVFRLYLKHDTILILNLRARSILSWITLNIVL